MKRLILFVMLAVSISNVFSEVSMIQPKTKLTQLDEDSLFIVFKHLNLEDMISVASANEYLSIVVGDYLSNRFSKKTIIFDFTKYIFFSKLRSSRGGTVFVTNIHEPSSKNEPAEPRITEDDDSIKFEYADDQIKTVLKMVGSEIRKLKIVDREFVQLGDDIKTIFKLIEQQCSESLIELHVEELKKFFLNVKKPFNKIEKLTWSTHGKTRMTI